MLVQIWFFGFLDFCFFVFLDFGILGYIAKPKKPKIKKTTRNQNCSPWNFVFFVVLVLAQMWFWTEEIRAEAPIPLGKQVAGGGGVLKGMVCHGGYIYIYVHTQTEHYMHTYIHACIHIDTNIHGHVDLCVCPVFFKLLRSKAFSSALVIRL